MGVNVHIEIPIVPLLLVVHAGNVHQSPLDERHVCRHGQVYILLASFQTDVGRSFLTAVAFWQAQSE